MSRRFTWSVSILACLAAGGCAALRPGGSDELGPVAENVVATRRLTNRGIESMNRGEWHNAELVLRQAVISCPVDEAARRNYAETLWHRDERDLAIDQMQIAVRLSGDNPEAIVRLGQMYLAEGNLDRAYEMAEKSVAGRTDLAAAWALRGDVLARRDNMESTLASYHRALSLDPDLRRIQLELARIYRLRGQHHQALIALQQLSNEYPAGQEPNDLLYQQGLAYRSLGRNTDAIMKLELASQREQPAVEIFFALAETRLLTGDITGARLAAEQTITAGPDGVRGRELLAQIESEERRIASLGRQPNTAPNRITELR